MKLKKLFLSLCLASSLVVSLLPLSSAFAAGSTLYVSPSSQTVNNGNTFDVQLRATISASDASSGYGINASLTFPRNTIQVVSLSDTGNGFSQATQQSYNNSGSTTGTITVWQPWGSPPGPTGDKLITTITFRTLTTGSATVGFSFGKVGNNSPTKSGGTYSIVTPPPSPPPTPPSSPTSPPTSSPSTSQPAPKKPATSSPPTTPSTVTPEPTAVDPSIPASSATSEAGIFITQNLPVSLKVVNSHKNPIQNATILIAKKTFHTDKNGVVQTKLNAGTNRATIISGGTKKQVSFIVKTQLGPAKSVETQNFTFVLDPPASFPLALVLGGGGAVIVLVTTGVGLFLLKRRRTHSTTIPLGSVPIAEPAVAPETTSEQPPEAVESFTEPEIYQPPQPEPAIEAAPAPPVIADQPLTNPEYAPVEAVAVEPPAYQELQAEPEPYIEPTPQAAPVTAAAEPSPAETSHKQYNSVYLNEEEPKDMYEVANEQFHYHDRPDANS